MNSGRVTVQMYVNTYIQVQPESETPVQPHVEVSLRMTPQFRNYSIKLACGHINGNVWQNDSLQYHVHHHIRNPCLRRKSCHSSLNACSSGACVCVYRGAIRETLILGLLYVCLQLITLQQLEDVILVGHSLAGVWMQLLVQQIPNRIAGLIFINAAVLLPRESFFANRIAGVISTVPAYPAQVRKKYLNERVLSNSMRVLMPSYCST